ncbi:LysR family transcriptional regulator [Bradyrhizobium sp. AUGA SZCCT0177]|uniref:LysR family transcriptional regulator n=1 Tax=Bradyrhizobium sp. AUGA SZCCT0177 TaxID=2807665 RepID=UPI001BABB4E0|nr:LysR family transcriptional regulator [Bradyrhizobium sp. AUGA SZCCT0177]MBR1281264.1 LysR family transcriptional regulator [Bradyrhizobium sp. AUGA SZCCT0177]
MDSTDLVFFSAVAVAGGIGRAASELNTVQSNVTSHIRALETKLGVRLFYRSKKGVVLTSVGNTLLPYATRIADLLTEARKAVTEAGPRGDLRIGSMETTAALRLPPILRSYAAQYSDVDIKIETGPTSALIDLVLARKLDGAFVCGPLVHEDIVSIPIVEEELVLVTPPSVQTRLQLKQYLSQTAGRKVIVFRAGCSYRRRIQDLLAQHGTVDIRWMEMGTLDGIIGCVAASLGISLLPRAVIKSFAEAGQVSAHALRGESGKAMTVFIHRRDAFVSSALHCFMERALQLSASPGGGTASLRKASKA